LMVPLSLAMASPAELAKRIAEPENSSRSNPSALPLP